MFEQIPDGSSDPIVFLIDGSGGGICLLLLFALFLVERLIRVNSASESDQTSEARNDR